MFDIKTWQENMRTAIGNRNGDWLAELMYQNDGNGVFSFEQSCFEFGETTREEWLDSLIECAEEMLASIDN